jgi:hypothetical protein
VLHALRAMATKGLWHLGDCRDSGGKLGNRSRRGRPVRDFINIFANLMGVGEGMNRAVGIGKGDREVNGTLWEKHTT